MGVDQPGRDGAPGEIDRPGLRPAQLLRPGVVAEIDDPPAAHGQAPLHPAGRLHRIEDSVPQDEVGTVLCKGGSDAAERKGAQQQESQYTVEPRPHSVRLPASGAGSAEAMICKVQASRKPL